MFLAPNAPACNGILKVPSRCIRLKPRLWCRHKHIKITIHKQVGLMVSVISLLRNKCSLNKNTVIYKWKGKYYYIGYVPSVWSEWVAPISNSMELEQIEDKLLRCECDIAGKPSLSASQLNLVLKFIFDIYIVLSCIFKK